MQVADLFAALRLKPDHNSFGDGDRLINGIKRGLTYIATYEGVKWLANLVQGTANAADHVAKLAQSTGVASDTLQELGYVGSLADVSIDEMGHSLQHLARNMEGAKKGGGEMASAFRKIGISGEELRSGSLKTDDVLARMADKFSTMPDGPEKTAIAMQVMGRAGARMIPLLNDGSKGIAKLRQEARDLGLVIDQNTLNSIQEFNDQETRLGKAWEGLKIDLLKALLPTLKGIVDGMVAWVKANREMLAQRMHAVAELLAKALTVVGKAIGYMLDALEFLDAHWDIAKYAIYGIVAALAVYEAATIAAGVASAISWLAGLWPIGLLIAAIGLVLLIIEDLYYAFTGEGDSVFGRFAKMIQDKFGVDIIGSIKTLVRWIGGIAAVFIKVGETVGTILSKIDDGIGATIEKVGELLDLGNSSLVTDDRRAKMANFNMINQGRKIATEGAADQMVAATKNPYAITMTPTSVQFAPGVREAAQHIVDARTTVNVTVNGGHPDEVQQAVTDAMKDSQGDAIRTAQSGTGGG